MKTITYKKIIPLLLTGLLHNPLWADTSALSSSISANPSISHFEAIKVGESSGEVKTQVRNIGTADLTIQSLSLAGGHADQYRITSDNCSLQTLAANASCEVGVKFEPTQAGYKQALLNIFSNSSDTPALQAFLTNYEDSVSESARRLPPVLYSLDVPEVMTAGQTYTLKWSILGYHDDYSALLTMFDCSGITNGSCGSNYSSPTRFFSSSGTQPTVAMATNWEYNGILAKEFKYEVEYTPTFTQNTDIVLRFYRWNNNDEAINLAGLSLLIPGNLSEAYYDKEGRRIQKSIQVQ